MNISQAPVFPDRLTAEMLKGFRTTDRGCTHPRVGEINGSHFIAKCGSWSDYSSDRHVQNELVADEFLRAAGFKVPESREYTVDFDDGLGPQVVRLAAYGDDLEPLMLVWQRGDDALNARIRAQVLAAYPVQAFIAGIDTFTFDNVKVDRDGKLWFVDNGSSFNYRACGKKKGWYWDRENAESTRSGYLSLWKHPQQVCLQQILGKQANERELWQAASAVDFERLFARLPEAYRRDSLKAYAAKLNEAVKQHLGSEDAARTEIVFILDRSGSMTGREADVIGGFNRMIAEQQAKSGECNVSTVLFDDAMEILHDRTPVTRVRPITEQDYNVRGCTAYFDALGRAILHHIQVQRYLPENRRAEKVMFVVMTDGSENASRQFSAQMLSQLIKDEQDKWGWEFLFIGAGIDAIQGAAELGIGADRAINVHKDAQGMRAMWRCTSSALANLRARRKFFCNEDGSSFRDEVDRDYNSRK